ncbi:MAG TPA: outer membrane protein assembly factor BamD [Fibrobacteria bacterium]|jgi:outer membrane protein assembly factor BamD|nr:outer membrane protein assembly factor BamD [Fibrobacteria bacterium]
MKRLLSLALPIAVCSLAGLVLLAGCSKKPKDLKGDCRERFEKLHGRYEKGRYAYAKEGYGDFVVTCAGTEHVEQAQFELGDSHFRLKEWMEAEQEFSAFLRDYPTSRRYAETARWLLARSMAKQVQIPQRDQTKTLEAIREMETFIAEFPDAAEADSARTELTALSQRLADRDMLVARLYSRMDEPLAAVIYYKYLLTEYGDRVPRRDINLKLAECYIKLDQFPEAENVLVQFDGVAQDDPFAKKIAATRAHLEKAKAKYERRKGKEQRQADAKDTVAVPEKPASP